MACEALNIYSLVLLGKKKKFANRGCMKSSGSFICRVTYVVLQLNHDTYFMAIIVKKKRNKLWKAPSPAAMT